MDCWASQVVCFWLRHFFSASSWGDVLVIGGYKGDREPAERRQRRRLSFSTEELFLTQGINTLTCSEVVQLWKLGVVVEIGL